MSSYKAIAFITVCLPLAAVVLIFSDRLFLAWVCIAIANLFHLYNWWCDRVEQKQLEREREELTKELADYRNFCTLEVVLEAGLSGERASAALSTLAATIAKSNVPPNCKSCHYFHGRDSINCAVHPHGNEDCSDWQARGDD